MKLKPITRKKAIVISNKIGCPISEDDGRTFYATNETETDVWEFNTRQERNRACYFKYEP